MHFEQKQSYSSPFLTKEDDMHYEQKIEKDFCNNYKKELAKLEKSMPSQNLPLCSSNLLYYTTL